MCEVRNHSGCRGHQRPQHPVGRTVSGQALFSAPKPTFNSTIRISRPAKLLTLGQPTPEVNNESYAGDRRGSLAT